MLADPDEFGNILTTADAAQLLGVSVGRVQVYCREGTIPAYRPPGMRHYYIMKDELLGFLRAERQPQPQEDDTPVHKARTSGR